MSYSIHFLGPDVVWRPKFDFDDFSPIPLDSLPSVYNESEKSIVEADINEDIDFLLKQVTEASASILTPARTESSADPGCGYTTSDNESDHDDDTYVVKTLLNTLSLQATTVSNFPSQTITRNTIDCVETSATNTSLEMPIFIGEDYFKLNETGEVSQIADKNVGNECLESQYATLFPSASKPTEHKKPQNTRSDNETDYRKHLAANAQRYRNLGAKKDQPESKLLNRGIDIGRNTNYVLRPRLD